MSTKERLTQFDYLLNSFEQASQSAEPAKNGYGDKRRALYAYVHELETRAALDAPVAQELSDEAIIDLARVASTENKYAAGRFTGAHFERGHILAFARAVITAKAQGGSHG